MKFPRSNLLTQLSQIARILTLLIAIAGFIGSCSRAEMLFAVESHQQLPPSCSGWKASVESPDQCAASYYGKIKIKNSGARNANDLQLAVDANYRILKVNGMLRDIERTGSCIDIADQLQPDRTILIETWSDVPIDQSSITVYYDDGRKARLRQLP